MKGAQISIASVLLVASGCAADLARASSGAIGCDASEIRVDRISVGWSHTSWTAHCRSQTFRCADERHPSCTPDLGSASVAPATSDEKTP